MTCTHVIAGMLQLLTGLALYAFGLLLPLNRNLVASTRLRFFDH